MAETETYVRLIQMIKSVLKLLVLNCTYTIPGSACTSWHVFAVLSLETCLMQGSKSISVIVHIVHHYQKKQKERSLLTNGATQSYEERGAKSVGCKLYKLQKKNSKERYYVHCHCHNRLGSYAKSSTPKVGELLG